MSRKKLFYGCIAAILIFIALVTTFFWMGWDRILTLSYIQQQRFVLKSYVDSHYVPSLLTYVIIYAICVICMLPVATLFTITGGFLFGTLTGALAAAVGATLGAMIFFVLIRASLGVYLQNRYRDRLAWFNHQVHDFGVYFLIAMRLIVVIPFFLANLLAGLTTISFATFTWTTALGVLPGDFVYAFAGSEICAIQSLADVYSPRVIAALVGLAVFALLPIAMRIIRKKIGRHTI